MNGSNKYFMFLGMTMVVIVSSVMLLGHMPCMHSEKEKNFFFPESANNNHKDEND